MQAEHFQYHTKSFYRDKLWENIVKHPEFTLGDREIEAFERFVNHIVPFMPSPLNIIHLGIGTGREIEYVLSALDPAGTYVINDICEPVLKAVYSGAHEHFETVDFKTELADIESPGTIAAIRSRVHGPALIVLAANSVIFSNRMLDAELRAAMGREDRLMLTMETPHLRMFKSYLLEPVFNLLSNSGMCVTAQNVHSRYDDEDQCLKLSCNGKLLLAAYKPQPDQLVARMKKVGLEPVLLQPYREIQMLAGLFRVETQES